MSGMASPLEGAAVNLNALRDDHSLAFTELLDSVPGSKLLVMDFQLSNVLNNVFTQGPKILKEHGVIDLLELNWGSGKVEQEKYRDASVVYVIRPSVTRAKQIAEHVSAVSLLSPCTDATPSGCDETVCLGGIPLAGGSVAGYGAELRCRLLSLTVSSFLPIPLLLPLSPSFPLPLLVPGLENVQADWKKTKKLSSFLRSAPIFHL